MKGLILRVDTSEGSQHSPLSMPRRETSFKQSGDEVSKETSLADPTNGHGEDNSEKYNN